MSRLQLDRQVDLLRYLTSERAVFGSGRGSAAILEKGFDEGRLRLEALFSFKKRMGKIRGICPRTVELLGETEDEAVREFVASCPPNEASRLANAKQFRSFLDAWWRSHPPDPAYLPDVAACEIAMAEASSRMSVSEAPAAPASAVRRHPGAVLLRCAHDVRPVFEPEPRQREVVRRETLLAVARPAGASAPTIVEIVPALFSLVESMGGWVPLAAFDAPGIEAVIAELAGRGLVETRP